MRKDAASMRGMMNNFSKFKVTISPSRKSLATASNKTRLRSSLPKTATEKSMVRPRTGIPVVDEYYSQVDTQGQIE